MSKYGLPKSKIIWMFRCQTLTLEFGDNGHVEVLKQGRKLAQRINNRKGMNTGDPRVDISHEGERISIHVSNLVWMYFCGEIPKSFEIHHIDENPLNNAFDNLLCLHYMDHREKFHPHACEEEIPF